MFNKDAKKIMQEKFDKDRNYQKIINNIEKNNNKKLVHRKTLKYTLGYSCAMVTLCATIITIGKSNQLGDKNIIAKVDNTENTINLPIVELNKTEENVEIANTKEIYKTVKGEIANWVYDPTEPLNLIDNTSSVVKVKIISIDDAEILQKQENFYNPYIPYTPVKMQILETLKGNQLSETIKAYLEGGKIKIGNLSNTDCNNLGITNIEKETQKEKYLEYVNEYDYEMNIGEEYIIIVKKVNEKLYRISANGYSIFKNIKSNEYGKYQNVLTEKFLYLN